jgi:hypothetical protein
VDAPLHIWVNYYGSHGHSVSGVNRTAVKVHRDEGIRHGPVRILMRDGQWLREPELIESVRVGAREQQVNREQIGDVQDRRLVLK